MSTDIALTKLTPHPKNDQLPTVDAATYAAMKEDIAEHGILHPVTVNARTWHIVMGHHRVQIAQELGWESVPVDLIDVDDTEEERLMIADNLLRRQIDKPMDKARLIRWLKELHGVRQGKTDSSLKFNEEAKRLGVAESTLRNMDKLNDLIPDLQALVDSGALPQTVGTDLARKFTPDQQQTLYDKLGAAQMSRLKTADIQAAKKAPDTSDLQDQIAALQQERQALEDQLQAAPTPDLLSDLQAQLAATDDTRQQYADELARLKSQTPVERIVEKVIEVEKLVPDPGQAAVIARLEQELQDAQRRIESLAETGDARRSLDQIQTERKAAEKRLEELRHAMARAVAPDGKADQVRMYRATIAKFVEDVQKKLKPVLGDWQQVGAREPLPANWMLYLDIQRTADSLEAIATGLRRIPLDPAAGRKHGMDGTVIDTTATPTKGEDYGDHDPEHEYLPLAD